GHLGTVSGLLNAFRGIALTGSGRIGAVSAGLAEALVPFAFALLIAIPSLWAYAYLRGRVRRRVTELTLVLQQSPPGPR
ncbi:MAG: MotA/TolQ/ExbB proton channel family protein, partial [Vicinamibacteria bacterium]